MDPRVRLDRRYPGQGLAEPPAIAARLWLRDREARAVRILPGDKLQVRGEVKLKRPGRMASPSPNAPLLKRIVRYPYREHVARGRRLQVFQPIERTRLDTTIESAVKIVRDLRDPIALGNPLRVIDRSRVSRDACVVPSVDQWLAGRS